MCWLIVLESRQQVENSKLEEWKNVLTITVTLEETKLQTTWKNMPKAL